MSWWRHPVLHFLVLGGCLFAGDSLLARSSGQAAPPEPALATAQERVDELRRDWLARSGRAPRGEELAALLERERDEELLLREARARGYHRSDALVRRRLVRNMRFVADDPDRSDDELHREALALGMDRSDLVVRRRLIQRMELQVRAAARVPEPGEAELAAFLEREAERFREPGRVRLSHVFLSRDARGADLEADAAALLSRLRDGAVDPATAGGLGDRFLLGHHLPPRAEAELAKNFGAEFARSAFGLETGVWAGPVASSYGLHLVWVHERTDPRVPDLAAVRGAVREALLAERGDLRMAQELAWLRARR